MAKRIYSQSVIKWLIGIGSTGTLIGGIFLYLYLTGAIDILGYSGDMMCAGNELDPCYAYINFTAKEDIFIYPTDYDPWGRNTSFDFDPAVESWLLQRSWGKGWRTIPLDKSCTGTWCGLSSSKDTRKFSVAFREGKTYQIRIVAYKKNPRDVIKWTAFEVIDPYWLSPFQVEDKVVKELCNPNYKDKIESIPHYKLIKGQSFPNGTIIQDEEVIDFYEVNIIGKEQIGCRKTGKVNVSGKIIQDKNRWCKLEGEEICCMSNIDGGRYGNWGRKDGSVDNPCRKVEDI